MTDKIKELENRIAALEAMAYPPVSEVEEKPWPQDGDEFWYISSCGYVYEDFFSEGNDADENCLSLGNLFRTEKEAEKRLKHNKALVKLRSLVPDGYVPDWSNTSEQKIYVFYNANDEIFKTSWTLDTRNTGQIYFPTKEAAEHAIEAMGTQLNDLLHGGF